jgi:hypothetical protein
MIPIVLFASSGTGIIAFLLFKRWEWAHGRVLFPRMRMKLDRMATQVFRTSKEKTPQISKDFSQTLIARLRQYGRTIVIVSIRNIEKRLRRVRDLIDGKIDIQQNGSASFYLKDVAEHKRKMANRRRMRGEDLPE